MFIQLIFAPTDERTVLRCVYDENNKLRAKNYNFFYIHVRLEPRRLRHITILTQNSRENFRLGFIDKSGRFEAWRIRCDIFFSVLKASRSPYRDSTGPFAWWWNLEFSFLMSLSSHAYQARHNQCQLLAVTLFLWRRPTTKLSILVCGGALRLIIRHEGIIWVPQNPRRSIKFGSRSPMLSRALLPFITLVFFIKWSSKSL